MKVTVWPRSIDGTLEVTTTEGSGFTVSVAVFEAAYPVGSVSTTLIVQVPVLEGVQERDIVVVVALHPGPKGNPDQA